MLESLLNRSLQCCEPCLRVAPQMNSQRPPSALRQHLKVAACLRRFHHSECVFLSRHRKFDRIVASDLQEYARVRTAFISLSSRVQKTRAEPQARCHALVVADRMPQHLQHLLMLRIHLDVAEHREVIAGLDARQVSLQISGERGVGACSLRQLGGILFVGEELDAGIFKDRLLRRERTSLFVFRSQIPRRDLAGFDVGLVEGVNSDDRASHGSGNLPSEKFRAQS